MMHKAAAFFGFYGFKVQKKMFFIEIFIDFVEKNPKMLAGSKIISKFAEYSCVQCVLG